MSEKVKCAKVTRPETHGNSWCVYDLAKFSAKDEFDGAEVGEKITLELIEMTQEELDTLPDFEGW